MTLHRPAPSNIDRKKSIGAIEHQRDDRACRGSIPVNFDLHATVRHDVLACNMNLIKAEFVITPRGAFAIEDEGDMTAPPVLMIVGLGLQLDFWPRRLIDTIRHAGLRVIRMDNRDAGLSRCMDELGTPSLPWLALRRKLGIPARPPYALHDMADDCLAVLDRLTIPRAHIVGISMGGMIAQHLAAAAPHRVISLTSIMSSSGDPRLPGPSGTLARKLLQPIPRRHDKLVEHLADLIQMISSPGYPTARETTRRQLETAMRRSYQPRGVIRQLAAIISDTERPGILADITSPTLVLHGRDDPLLPPDCGRDTARRIAGSTLRIIDGMGHDLADGLCPLIAHDILAHVRMHASPSI
jgi:pimeloyl-ACP methyl ester carboxylesterase